MHVTSGGNISIRAERIFTKTPPMPIRTVQDLLLAVSNEDVKGGVFESTHGITNMGHYDWVKTVVTSSSDKRHYEDEYRTKINDEYALLISVGLGTRGKPDETRLAELRKVGERIVASVHIE